MTKKKQSGSERQFASLDKSEAKNAAYLKPTKKNSAARGKGFALDVAGSKCMSDARWSPSNGGTLAVTFARDGSQYLYYGVDRSTAKGITSGEALNAEIIGEYDYD